MCKTLISKTSGENYEINPNSIVDYSFVHKHLNVMEQKMDSNERELLAARHLIFGSTHLLKDKSVTLHFDSLNAANIIMKGSSKFRLQWYALQIEQICTLYNIKLKTVWIPRSLNKLADKMSKLTDIEDYSVTDEFFVKIEEMSGLKCTYDIFANNLNCKTKKI